MVIGTKARVLVAALALGMAGVGLSMGQAEARRNDNGVRCAIEQDNGHIDFYLPGEKVVRNGKTLYCGSNGEWWVWGPRPGGDIVTGGGGVYAPVP